LKEGECLKRLSQSHVVRQYSSNSVIAQV
jgi:hypothetical protein